MPGESFQDRLNAVLNGKDGNAARWLLVAIGVVVLLRLRLILFAAALPIIAYWHYSQQAASGDSGEAEAADEQRRGEDDKDLDMPGYGKPDRDPDDDDRLDDDLGLDDDLDGPRGNRKEDSDIYDDSFWAGGGDHGRGTAGGGGKANAPWKTGGGGGAGPKPSFDDDGGKDANFSWDGGRDELDDLLANDFGGSGRGPSSGGFRGGGGLDDMDILGDLGNDMDFGFGGGKGKGKGKGKKDGKMKDPNAPREADPRQVFVAGVADAQEDEIREFFEKVGEVIRLKILTNPDDGTSKGVCFVTFQTAELAQKALRLHQTSMDGKNITVRLAHGGNKGAKGEGGGMKGEGRGPREDREPREFAPDLGGSARFGEAFGGGRMDADRNKGGAGGKGKGGGKGGGRDREIEDALEEALADQEGPLRVTDFDFAARRFLTELRVRDRQDSGSRFREAIEMVLKYTSSKDRAAVRKWTAYVFTLLQKFDPAIAEELREKEQDRRAQKGGGFKGGRPERKESDD